MSNWNRPTPTTSCRRGNFASSRLGASVEQIPISFEERPIVCHAREIRVAGMPVIPFVGQKLSSFFFPTGACRRVGRDLKVSADERIPVLQALQEYWIEEGAQPRIGEQRLLRPLVGIFQGGS